jgi:2-oxoglutarate ferredoxin oxidoreductase subunit delta
VKSLSGIDVKYHLKIDRERCKGCELCLAVCPKKVLGFSEALNSRGSHWAVVVSPEACIGCLQCADICPEAAIEIEQETE